MQLLLIRHAQSHNNAVWAAQGNSQGRLPDPPLTGLGRAQAAALAGAFSRGDYPMRPTVLLTSLMSRTIQTAAPLAAALGVPIQARADAFEVGGPLDWDGHERSERRHHRGSPAAQLRAHSAHLVLPPEATEAGWWPGPIESVSAAPARAARLLAALRALYAGTDAVIGLVSHEWFGQFLIREVLGDRHPDPEPDADPDRHPEAAPADWITLHNSGVSWFTDVDGGAGDVTARWLNRTTHLRPDQVTG